MAGAARDHLLGFAGVNGCGEAFKVGSEVVKNVTGYDLPKLVAGSRGTLAALTKRVKESFDPKGFLNPGRSILLAS